MFERIWRDGCTLPFCVNPCLIARCASGRKPPSRFSFSTSASERMRTGQFRIPHYPNIPNALRIITKMAMGEMKRMAKDQAEQGVMPMPWRLLL